MRTLESYLNLIEMEARFFVLKKLRFDTIYIQIAELATPTSSRLLSPFLG